MKEDTIVQSIVEEHSQYDHIEIELEKQYNHYGDRGAVDMVIVNHEENAMWIIEVKSDTAVKEATGANEIIRQFNKHREYFLKGVDTRYNVKRGRTNYELVFAATDVCYNHLIENKTLYQNIADQDFCHITLNHPDRDIGGKPFKESDWHDGWHLQESYNTLVDSIPEPNIEGVSE